MSKCITTQGFGGNANPTYASQGQRGHTGVDDSCGYGSKVYALKKGIVYKILDKDHPARDGSGYWAVFMICQESDGRYVEWQIGHLSKIYCKVGDVVEAWDFIGEEGNRGIVFAGNIQITKAMQDAGDRRGSHRHYNKKYLNRRLDIVNAPYLTTFSLGNPELYRDKEGYYYSVENGDNGYSGSVDCAKDIADGRKFVDEHFTLPKPIPPAVQVNPAERKLRIKLIFNNTKWPSIDAKIAEIKAFFAPKFDLQCDVVYSSFTKVPFQQIAVTDGSSGVELHGTSLAVESIWYDKNITEQALAYDIVLFYVSSQDKQGYVTSAGIRGDNYQGPVELTIFGINETDHAYNQGVDMGNAFSFFACHEIAHAIAMLFGIQDNTHKYFYAPNAKDILNDYNFDRKSYDNGVVERIKRAVLYILKLLGVHLSTFKVDTQR